MADTLKSRKQSITQILLESKANLLKEVKVGDDSEEDEGDGVDCTEKTQQVDSSIQGVIFYSSRRDKVESVVVAEGCGRDSRH